MIKVKNLQYHENLGFDDYLKLPGFSYSGLKARESKKEVVETDKMRFGTEVHKYLLTPKELTRNDPKVRGVVLRLKQSIPVTIFKSAKPELSVTADFEYEDFVLPWKGRIDLPVIPKLIIDLKVTEMTAAKAMEFFRYDRQISGYCIATRTKLGFIAAVHPETGITDIEKVPIDEWWWIQMIKKYGSPTF